MTDRTAPQLPHNSPKPFTISYKTISREHQVTAFERPSLSPDLISEIVSFNSGYKSQWNGHFKWSGATWLLSEQRGVSRHSVSEQIGQKDNHVRRECYGEVWFRYVLERSRVVVSVHTECQGWGFRCFLIRSSIIPEYYYINSRQGCLPLIANCVTESYITYTVPAGSASLSSTTPDIMPQLLLWKLYLYHLLSALERVRIES